MPALAILDDDYCDDRTYDVVDSASDDSIMRKSTDLKNSTTITTSTSMNGFHSFPTYHPTSTPTRNLTGGGGSGGRQKCPKCGMSVTFKHADL